MLAIRTDKILSTAHRTVTDDNGKVWNFFGGDHALDLTVFDGVSIEDVNKVFENMFEVK